MSAQHHNTRPSRRIEMFAGIVFAGLALACIYHATLESLGFKFPWNTFLFMPEDRFNDWHNSVAAAGTRNPYYSGGRALSTYFPVTYLVFLLGVKLPRAVSTAVYLGISMSSLAASIILAWQYLRPLSVSASRLGNPDRRLLLLACFFSYPVLFALDRGNLDVWIASLCLIHVATLRTRYYALGFAAIAFAISMKAYPLAFLALAVAERKYRPVVLCAIAAGMMTVLTLAGMWDGFAHNLNGLQLNLRGYYRLYVLGSHSLFASSDPYNGIRSFALIGANAWQQFIAPTTPAPNVLKWSENILQIYSLLSLGFALLCALFVLAIPAPRWRRIMAVCLVALLFPNVASDYKLTLLLPGTLALLLDSDATDRRSQIAFLTLCLLMIPKSYYFAYGTGLTNIINPLLLIVLSKCVLADRAAWRRGLRLLRFRVVWHAAHLGDDSWLLRVITHGRPAPFLTKNHRSMDLG